MRQARGRRGARGTPRSPARRPARPGATGTLPGLRAALPDREIAPGELLPLAGRRLRAIWTPGHTPGHVCLHLEEAHPSQLPGHGRLFSGDHLLPGITPHIGLYEDPDDAACTDPLGDYLDSLERVGRLGVAEVLPAHQHPFTGAQARVAQLLAHHEDRLNGLLALLSTPLTPWQLAERMEWNRPWEQIPYGSRTIAVSEAEAHVRRLEKRGGGRVGRGVEPDRAVGVPTPPTYRSLVMPDPAALAPGAPPQTPFAPEGRSSSIPRTA